jgi:outer membrane protein assembly factor BamB
MQLLHLRSELRIPSWFWCTTPLLLLSCIFGTVLPLRGADWNQFRGPFRDGISRETGLMRAWPESGPRVLWSAELGQGYSAAVIVNGLVYFNDYDVSTKEWLVRCLTLDKGKEVWRFREKRRIRPNHAITRTVPAVDGAFLFSLDPKAVLHCLDIKTGEQLWRKELVKEYSAKIPPWYNGQCPLIEDDRIIIAAGGDVLLVALKKATGDEIWRSSNPGNQPMTHASPMPAEFGGVKQYLYTTLKGVYSVAAQDGKILWHAPFKLNVAVAPSPIAVDDSLVFLTSGYNAGTAMFRIEKAGGKFSAAKVFELSPAEWNSEIHTPIIYKDHLFAVGRNRRGLFTCLDKDGKIVWDSRGKASFDMGSFLLADGMFFILDGKTGLLRILEASTTEYRELGSSQVLSGHDVWGPMALSDGKLVLRDLTKMVCIDVGK